MSSPNLVQGTLNPVRSLALQVCLLDSLCSRVLGEHGAVYDTTGAMSFCDLNDIT